MGRRIFGELMAAGAAAVAVLIMIVMLAAMGVRVPGIETAYAGGGTDLDAEVTIMPSKSGSIYNGEDIYVKSEQLAKAYGMSESEFMGLVNSGEINVHFAASYYKDDDTAMLYPIQLSDGEYSEEMETTYSDGAFRASVDPGWYPHEGIYAAICLFTIGSDSAYSNNTKGYKVIDRFVTKASIDTKYSQSVGTETATLTMTMNGLGEYLTAGSESTSTAYYTMFRFFNKSNKEIAHFEQSSSYYLTDMTIPIEYGTNEITLALYSMYNGKEYFAQSYTLTIKSAELPKNAVAATKISTNKAIVRWGGVYGADGYYIYQGSKKVKTVKASVRKATISKKGAGKAKFKVIPYIKSGSKTYKGTSATAKPKANTFKTGIGKSYTYDGYGKGTLRLEKVSASGKTYKVTFRAFNNRMFRLVKYKKITFKLYADGKLVAKKTLKNKKVNAKKYSTKAFTVKIKGKEGDIRNGTVTYSVSATPIWEHGYKAF